MSGITFLNQQAVTVLGDKKVKLASYGDKTTNTPPYIEIIDTDDKNKKITIMFKSTEVLEEIIKHLEFLKFYV